MILFINSPSTYLPSIQCLSPGPISIKIMNVWKGKSTKLTFLFCVHLTARLPHELSSLAPRKWDNAVDLDKNAQKKGFVSLHYLTVLIVTIINTITYLTITASNAALLGLTTSFDFWTVKEGNIDSCYFCFTVLSSMRNTERGILNKLILNACLIVLCPT